MIRKVLLALALLYVGLMAGEIRAGKSRVGEIVWRQTMQSLEWSGNQAHSLVSYAGVNESFLPKWLFKPKTSRTVSVQSSPAVAAPSPFVDVKKQPLEDNDEEGLTPQDKEALRQILE